MRAWVWCGGPSTIANERQRSLSLIARSNRLSEDASGVGLEVWAMPEAGRSMVISDVRQTSPSCANAPLAPRSAYPPDLDPRQVLGASEWRGHEVESRSDLGPGRHPWRRTGTLRRVPGSRLEAPAAVARAASMKDLVRRRTAQGRVRPDLVVPFLKPHQRRTFAHDKVADTSFASSQPMVVRSPCDPPHPRKSTSAVLQPRA